MQERRDKIKSEMTAAMNEIAKLDQIKSQLEAAEAVKKGALTDTKAYANFIRHEKAVTYQEISTHPRHNTLCQTCAKEKTCHESCGLEYSGTTNETLFRGCACISGGKCRECGCGPEFHFHDFKKYKKVEETIENILKDDKAKYDSAIARGKHADSEIDTKSKDMAALNAMINRITDNIKQMCEELREICPHFNFVDELGTMLTTMRTQLRLIRTTTAKKDAEDRIRQLELFINNLSKMPPSKKSYAPPPLPPSSSSHRGSSYQPSSSSSYQPPSTHTSSSKQGGVRKFFVGII
jgi:hypothetical protein